MTTPYASIQLPTQFSGLVYASGTGLLPAAEGDLSTIPSIKQSPIPVQRTSNATAVVQFTRRGNFASASGYTVMQTDCGDGVWIDIAWCTFTSIAPAATLVFLLASSQFGPNAFQQTRASGTAPSSTGSNEMGLLGRVRFVGKVTILGTSSSSMSVSSGTPALPAAGVLVKITVKLQGLS